MVRNDGIRGVQGGKLEKTCSAFWMYVCLSRCFVVVQILQTGQEIMELDTSGFATQGPTVFAGNIGDNKYIIQVSPMGIRLLEGGEIKTLVENV